MDSTPLGGARVRERVEIEGGTPSARKGRPLMGRRMLEYLGGDAVFPECRNMKRP